MSDAPVIRKEWLPAEPAREPPLHHGEAIESSRFTPEQRQAVIEETLRNITGPRIPVSAPQPTMVTKDFAAPVHVPTREERLQQWHADQEREREEAQRRMREEETDAEARALEVQANADAWNEWADGRIARAFETFDDQVAKTFDMVADQLDALRRENDDLRNTVARLQSDVAELYVSYHANAKKSVNGTRKRLPTHVPVSITLPIIPK